MNTKTQPYEIWDEYQQGIMYKTNLDLYDTVERNENFYNGNQWEGVIAPNLPKPVFNFLKPVVNYYIAMLISDDIKAYIETGDSTVSKAVSEQIDKVIEHAEVKFKNRKMIRNCAIDGDACFYVWFDAVREKICVDLVDNTNVYFGNPSEEMVQEQPYIIIAYRRLTDEVREEAESRGVDPNYIVSDNEALYMNEEKDYENEYTTVLLKMWKENGHVWVTKTTEKQVIFPPTDTEYNLYPVTWLNWESVKNSYHGVSPVTSGIPNQIFVNKQYALAMIQMQNMAFPTILYDRARLPEGYRGGAGSVVGVSGSPDANIMSAFRPPDMSAQVSQFIDSAIKYTKDMMGASDAALGNVNPQNTSAIVAVQKAAALPLDIQRLDFYRVVENYIRIFIDIMRVNYGVRSVEVEENGEKVTKQVDFSLLDADGDHVKVEIGQAAYWSELTQIQTLDNLMDREIIPDSLTYLEAIPDGYVKNKESIMEKIRELMQQGLLEPKKEVNSKE